MSLFAGTPTTLATTLATIPNTPLHALTPADFAAHQQNALAAINAADTEQHLAELKALLTGKKSWLAHYSKQLGALSSCDKKTFGALLHTARSDITHALNAKTQTLADAVLSAKLRLEAVDITLPARASTAATLHPITQVQRRMQAFFAQAGFELKTGGEVESDYYNFEALNIPSHHPARAMHDTFYFDANYLLRTHTSAVQIHTMQKQQPPIRMICGGRVYRNDSDQTHSPMFHQMEGLYVNKDTNFAELKGLIGDFLQTFFGDKFGAQLEVRFRPSYFPFTEPSAEVDIKMHNGKWLEVMGCGMVHPRVLENCGINADEYQGFAFGMGIERFAMLYYGVNDLRLFFQNDVRFLGGFK